MVGKNVFNPFLIMNPDSSKKQIISLIRNGSNRITYENCSKKIIFKKTMIDGNYSKYVKCLECPDVYIVKYDQDSGAKGVNYHEETQHKYHAKDKQKQRSYDFYVPSTVTGAEKERVSRAAAIAAATDARGRVRKNPGFSFVEGFYRRKTPVF